MRKIPTSFNLDADVEYWIDKVAKANKRSSKSSTINLIFREWFRGDGLSDYNRELIKQMKYNLVNSIGDTEPLDIPRYD